MTQTETRPSKKSKKWSVSDDLLLTERFQSEKIVDLARMLGCTMSTVSKHARWLGLRKENPTCRNHDAREFVRMEFNNLSYREMAKRTGLCVNTIQNIVRELGLVRTPEQKWRNLRIARNNLIRREKARIAFGLEQKTRLKLGCNRKKVQARLRLRKLGYRMGKDGHTFYYHTDGMERSPRKEENSKKYGFKFLPLPDMYHEETIRDSASQGLPAVD